MRLLRHDVTAVQKSKKHRYQSRMTKEREGEVKLATYICKLAGSGWLVTRRV
jgi:hypothetical protein